MRKIILAASFAIAAVALAQPPVAFAQHGPVAPGARTLMLAHNAYPDHGKYTDRLDRALSSGQPFAVEQDLSWIDGKSLIIHEAKNVSGDDPTLESYFFAKVWPVIEKVLKEGHKSKWPIITLYLDIKNDPPEHLAAIAKVLNKYDSWLTSAVKTDDILRVSAFDLKPMMVLVEDKEDDVNKQQFFYDQVPVGGKLRAFGSVPKLDPNSGRKLPKHEAIDHQASVSPDDLMIGRADNYHATGPTLKKVARRTPVSGQTRRNNG